MSMQTIYTREQHKISVDHNVTAQREYIIKSNKMEDDNAHKTHTQSEQYADN